MDERLDAVDETILLALKEGHHCLANLSTHAHRTYHTCRQSLKTLIRYIYTGNPAHCPSASGDTPSAASDITS